MSNASKVQRKLTDREVNTLLCAMRGMYNTGRAVARTCDGTDYCEHIEALGENGERLLSREEADAFCEEIGLDMTIASYTVAEVSTCDSNCRAGHSIDCELRRAEVNS